MIKRRNFLKKFTAGMVTASTFPALIPQSVFGANDRITMGCIGMGGMGTRNMEAFLTKPEVRVVSVCDVDRKHMVAAKTMVDRRYGDTACKTTGDYREILSDPSIDAVMIGTPDQWHGIMGVAAARAGKDIYAEKPLAFSINEGRAIVNAVHQNEVIWQTGSWQRSHRHFRFACELVRNGYIGPVETVRVGLPFGNSIKDSSTKASDPPEWFDYEMWLGPAPWRPYSPGRCHWNFRWISDYSGGQLTDWAGHNCDIANWGMNTESSAPIYIEGKADFSKVVQGIFDTPPTYYFECQYNEGFKMIVADSSQQPRGMGAHFIGSEGWVHVNRSGLYTYPESLKKIELRPDDIRLYQSEDHYQNFIDCIKSRKPAITPVSIAYHAILVGHLGNIAMKLGRRVEWDHQREQFLDDEAANRMRGRPMRTPWRI